MSGEEKVSPGFAARWVAIAIGAGGVVMIALAMYFGVMDTMPMTISAEMAKSAGCPHVPPARFGTTSWDYVFALQGLTVGGSCKELSIDWLITKGREWLWIFAGTGLCIGGAAWNQRRELAMVCTGAGLWIATVATWVSLTV